MNNMEREVIEVTEFEIGPLCHTDYWKGIPIALYKEYFNAKGEPIKHHFSNDFDIIKDEVIEYSLEISYERIVSIIKRKDDGKYFKYDWQNSYWAHNYPSQIVEVFPKQVLTTIYE
jgi:hypothetical protein